MHNLGYNAYYANASNTVAAGVTNVNCASYDLVGSFGGPFDNFQAIATLGALSASQNTILKLQGCNDNATWVDLVNTHQGPPLDTASGQLLIVDVFRPQVRYIRPVVMRGTANAVIASVTIIAYNAHSLPVTTQDATVAVPVAGGSGSQGVSPAPGVPVNVVAYPITGAGLA